MSPVPGPFGMDWARKLARLEGIFTGVSGGETFPIAMQMTDRADDGTTILSCCRTSASAICDRRFSKVLKKR